MMELMIVLAIIGILAMIVMPSYTDYVKKSRRADAHAALTKMMLDQEKFRTNNPNYTTTIGSGGLNWGTGDITRTYYTIAITAADASSFTATATATGAQVSDAEGGTSCSTLTIAVTAGGDTRTPAACW